MAIFNRIGPGPITSANSWSVTKRLDKAGDFDFTMPGVDEMATYITARRNISMYATLDGAIRYMGGGTIDSISKKATSSGGVSMAVSGNDALRHLTKRTIVGAFQNHEVVDAIATLAVYAPGWTFYPDPAWVGAGLLLYMSFSGETVLACLIRIAEKFGAHIYLSGRRELQFQIAPSDSGVRAIQATGDLANETCGIADLEEITDSYQLKSRIIPFGAGTGNARLTLAACTIVPPLGYTLDIANNFLRHDATEDADGIDEARIEFKEIAPISNTDLDMEAAANSLYESAKHWLDLNRVAQKSYRLKVVGCSTILRPMQTIRIVYRDDNLSLNDDLLILESTVQGNTNNVYTTDLVVSNLARWPASDSGSVVEAIRQSSAFIAHPQLNANAYTTGYNKNVDDTYNATFRFRFGNEVAQINQVLFEFQILPLESTVKSVGGSTTTTSTEPSSSPTSSSGGGATPTSSTYAPAVNHSHQVEVVDSTPSGNLVYYSTSFGLNSSGAGAGTETPTTLTTLPLNHSHTVTVPAHAHNVVIPAHSHTLTPNIVTVYGIFRESALNTYGVGDLEYSVNSGTWFTLNTAAAVDAGWYQLDITPLVQNATTFRPTQISNRLDIRKAPAAAAKTATIDALLSVRNIIQAIAYL